MSNGHLSSGSLLSGPGGTSAPNSGTARPEDRQGDATSQYAYSSLHRQKSAAGGSGGRAAVSEPAVALVNGATHAQRGALGAGACAVLPPGALEGYTLATSPVEYSDQSPFAPMYASHSHSPLLHFSTCPLEGQLGVQNTSICSVEIQRKKIQVWSDSPRVPWELISSMFAASFHFVF